MKELYSLFILLFGSILFGQEYTSFLNLTNRWIVEQVEESEDDDFPYYIKYRLNPENTITYNSKQYTSVQWKWRYTNGWWAPPTPWSEWADPGIYISENVEEKKVFVYYDNFDYYNGTRNGEFLLYDFGLEIGDPIPTNGFINGEIVDAPIYVSSIEYQNVFGYENVKTFVSNNLSIYEGIGCSEGVFTLSEFNPQSSLSGFYQTPADYTPLIREEMGWEFSYNQWDFSNGQMTYRDYMARVSDEQINYNDKVYQAIEIRNRERIDETPQTEWSEWKTEFYLSESISQRKVYIYYPHNTTFNHSSGEFLLYDFSLEEGDVMHLEGFVNESFIDEAVVSSISYENVFGLENVRTHHLTTEDEFEFKVYEAVGSSTGLNTMSLLIDAGWTLTYYGVLSNKEFQAKQVKVYPNPFSDKIQIQNSEEIKQLQLFDLKGKLICTNKNIDDLNSKLGSLNNAVYFLKITFKNNKSETIKLIKNK